MIKQNKEEIIKKIEEWWKEEPTEKCLVKECDLCINCLNRLLGKFGGKWENGKFMLK